MQKTLFIKLSIIAGLCLIFGIGLAMIQSLVYERQRNAENVIQEITEQHVNAQQIITPFILLTDLQEQCPTTTQKTQETLSKTGNEVIAVSKACTQETTLHPFLPTQTKATQQFDVSDDTYKRGIYRSTSYQGTVAFEQKYQLKNHSTDNKANDSNIYNNYNNINTSIDKSNKRTATLLIPVSDLRGINQMPTVSVNGKKLEADYPVTTALKDLSYLEVDLSSQLLGSASELNVSISIPLAGMSEIQTIPLGKQFMLAMQTNWQTPKFVGQALPNQKNLTDTGFDASWQNQHLAISNNQLLTKCINHSQTYCEINTDVTNSSHIKGQSSFYATTTNTNKRKEFQQISFNSFDVQFAKPNSVYLQTERSLKYGLLLLAISFGSFFLFEVIKSLRIHPIQYLLVSMALLVFYVLLLSLAEQIAFWQAYAIAASACAGLIGWYAYYVLHSIKRAGIFTALLAAQYAGFFTILTAEESNLLIGAVLCFAIIASVMFLTRKIDWYAIK